MLPANSFFLLQQNGNFKALTHKHTHPPTLVLVVRRRWSPAPSWNQPWHDRSSSSNAKWKLFLCSVVSCGVDSTLFFSCFSLLVETFLCWSLSVCVFVCVALFALEKCYREMWRLITLCKRMGFFALLFDWSEMLIRSKKTKRGGS